MSGPSQSLSDRFLPFKHPIKFNFTTNQSLKGLFAFFLSKFKLFFCPPPLHLLLLICFTWVNPSCKMFKSSSRLGDLSETDSIGYFIRELKRQIFAENYF